MTQPVRSTNGKWRRTAGGLLRQGCCCDCFCNACKFAIPDESWPAPCHVMLEFSGITLRPCIYGEGTCCHELSGSPNQTVVVASREAVYPGYSCCWGGDTGTTVTTFCECFVDPFGEPVTQRLFAGIKAVLVSGGSFLWKILLYGGNLASDPDPELSCDAMGGYPLLFKADIPVDSEFVGFCYEPMVVDNDLTDDGSACAPLGLGFDSRFAYGGSVTITPL